MNRKPLFVFLLILLIARLPIALADSPDRELLKKILHRFEENDEIAEDYGYSQESLIKELTDDGEISKQEKRTYETVWLGETRYFELVLVNDTELNGEQKKNEQKRRIKFMKEMKEKKDVSSESNLEVGWDDLFQKYDFDQLPSEEEAAYVISFKPKPGKKKERNRIEKIFNHLAGTIWVSSDFNLLKATAQLTNSVKYGLGILANIEEMQFHYKQQKMSDVWLPDTFSLKYKARVFVKTRIREMNSRFFDFARREAVPAAASQ